MSTSHAATSDAEQLQQAQKMEALGRLASGVAHDFNNLLSVILGYSELLLNMRVEPAIQEYLAEIKRAAELAAGMTGQILAFGRKQAAVPQVLDLNERVRDWENVLRRLLGDEVRLVTELEPALAQIYADPVQIEQVLLNLAVNARDAMPRGGTITIATENDREAEHPAGAANSYVVLTVRDTGCGMDEATLGRIFEPFFTTKDCGRGTGLGLATVYEIVHQNGGHMRVQSQRGQGTSFRLYFPAAAAVSEPARVAVTRTNSAGTHEVPVPTLAAAFPCLC
jgi:signal transduction histidine kinase